MKRLFFVLCIFLCAVLQAKEQAYISLSGHLDKSALEQAEQTLKSITPKMSLYLEIKSSSGDLEEVLEFAKRLYALKAKKDVEVVLFINDTALGPAAILPFLADRLYSAYFVSWGDIPLGTDQKIATNLLRNRVVSFIDPKKPDYALLSLMATAMTDPGVEVVDDKGWRIVSGDEETYLPRISPKNETLIVNHNQLQSLGIVDGVMSPEEFREQFKLLATQKKQEEELPTETLVKIKEPLEIRLKEHIHFNSDGPNTIGYITITEKDKQISQSTFLYIKNALDHYKKTKPAFIILELNTPGGEVFAAQKISDALKEMDIQDGIPVVTVINNWAISAGAMIAYATRFITAMKDGSMGAAEPVMVGQQGSMETASEKVNSALRTDFAGRARFFDRNPYIAEAMVDKDIILVLRHGKVVKLDKEDQIRTKGTDPDIIIAAKGKLLTLNAEQMIEYGVADLMLLPQKTELITAQERSSGKWPASKMVLFQSEFFKDIPNATVEEYQMDWKTRFFVILTSPIVASMLSLGMIVGFYIELNTPGFGIPGGIAITCLLLIILSSFALELAGWLEIILVLGGLSLIALDLFVIPSFGIVGVAGIILFLVGLFGMMLPGVGAIDFEFDTGTFNAAGEAFLYRLAWLCGTLIVAFIAILLLARFVTPSFRGFRRFVLMGDEQNAGDGYIAGERPEQLPSKGAKGEAVATLRPAGKVMIDDKQYDAVSRGGFIKKGSAIKVIGRDGSTLVVDMEEPE